MSETSDDALLTDLIPKAQAAIDAHCRRTFEAAADTTRYFTIDVHTRGADLFFDEDLATTPTTVTNQNGASTVAADKYMLLPANRSPKHGLRLLASKGVVWTFTGDPENAIAVTGRWAWSTSAPADIVQSCNRLVLYFYDLRDSTTYDAIANLELGVMQIPKGHPLDARELLRPYIRNNYGWGG